MFRHPAADPGTFPARNGNGRKSTFPVRDRIETPTVAGGLNRWKSCYLSRVESWIVNQKWRIETGQVNSFNIDSILFFFRSDMNDILPPKGEPWEASSLKPPAFTDWRGDLT